MAVGCVGVKSPQLLKYENEIVALDQRAARGEITQLEADNLKLQAHQSYLEARRQEEKLFNDNVDRQIKSQNQDINSVLRQTR